MERGLDFSNATIVRTCEEAAIHVLIAHPTLALQDTGGFSTLLDWVTKLTLFGMSIQVVLLLFSLLSWTIILRKWLTFRAIERQTGMFVSFFRKSPRLSEVNAAAPHYRKTPLAGLFSAGYQELNTQLETLKSRQPEPRSNPGHLVLTDRGLAGIKRALERAAAAELSVLEGSMSWLATTASVTPFIGLLGTVVGIISAFQGLGMEQTTSIQAVAPGIAEALIQTAAGLFAAIPAVIAYNQFVHRIKAVAAEMDDFSAEFITLVERSFT